MVGESQLALWLQLFSPLPQFHYCYLWYTVISMKENQNQYQFPPIQTDATSSLSCAIQFNTPQDQGSTHEECRLRPPQQQQEPHDHLSTMGGSSSHHAVDQTNEQRSAKWMSSKMRLMRKMLGSDQILVKKQRRTQSAHDQMQINQASSSSNINNNPNNDIIRVCSNCKTTKTPLWRGGPQGPKSLCNACGIRQMKARRAMRAAAGLTNCKMQQEERRSDVDRTVPFKKRFKINVTSASAQKKLRFDEITISLSNKSAFQQTIPQEEKDAAILLMALSCGLIHG